MNTALQGKIISSRVYPEFFSMGINDVVLHAGCGEGAQVLAYGKAGKRIMCTDVQKERVERTKAEANSSGIENIEGVSANLEALPFDQGTFDKIIAVDVIQHVQNPNKVLVEFHRVLKPKGELLITFPALQHYVLTKISKWKHMKREQTEKSMRTDKHEQWDPDQFNHNIMLFRWMRVGKSSGLHFMRSHATTLFPPLHRYGIPRFWFSNTVIHRIDYFLGGFPGIKQLGQALMCIYKKI